jgi:hypothetical protein
MLKKRIRANRSSSRCRSRQSNVPSTVPVRAKASEARPDNHPGEDDAGDEALFLAEHSELRLNGKPHEGQQHDLHGLCDPAGTQESQHQRLEPAEADARQRLIRRVCAPIAAAFHANQ